MGSGKEHPLSVLGSGLVWSGGNKPRSQKIQQLKRLPRPRISGRSSVNQTLRLQGNLSAARVAAQDVRSADWIEASLRGSDQESSLPTTPRDHRPGALANRLLHHPVDGHGILAIHGQDGQLMPLAKTAHAGEVDRGLRVLSRARRSAIGRIRTSQQQRQLRLLGPLQCSHPTRLRRATTGEGQKHSLAGGLQSPRSRCANW